MIRNVSIVIKKDISRRIVGRKVKALRVKDPEERVREETRQTKQRIQIDF